MFKFIAFIVVTTVTVSAFATVADFEDHSLPANSFYNGSDSAGGFSTHGAFFNNSYDTTFEAWEGWSYSDVQDSTTSGFGNQYAAFPGGGFNGSSNYGVAFGFGPNDAYINLPAGQTVQSAQVTNTTYTALDMTNGSPFSKKFGGPTGNDPDFFDVTFTGYSQPGATGTTTGSVTFYLADFRSADNSQDYIVNNWRLVDLTPLGSAQSIGLSFASSDVGQFGINTPTYVALDNLTFVPEPATLGVAGMMVLFLARRDRK